MQPTDFAASPALGSAFGAGLVERENSISLACFEVRSRLYAIDVSHVREIVRTREVTPLPMSPPLIEGFVELRDAWVPIIDLGRALGGEPCVVDGRTRIAVLEIDELLVGLRVEHATDVMTLDAGLLEDPPALATQAGYEVVRALVRCSEDRPVLVLSLEHILERVYCSGGAGGGSG
jgi:purine-binding chemotaxis protein CheW